MDKLVYTAINHSYSLSLSLKCARTYTHSFKMRKTHQDTIKTLCPPPLSPPNNTDKKEVSLVLVHWPLIWHTGRKQARVNTHCCVQNTWTTAPFDLQSRHMETKSQTPAEKPTNHSSDERAWWPDCHSSRTHGDKHYPWYTLSVIRIICDTHYLTHYLWHTLSVTHTICDTHYLWHTVTHIICDTLSVTHCDTSVAHIICDTHYLWHIICDTHYLWHTLSVTHIICDTLWHTICDTYYLWHIICDTLWHIICDTLSVTHIICDTHYLWHTLSVCC